MRLLNLGKQRILVQFISACAFCGLLYYSLCRVTHRTVQSQGKPQICHIAAVKADRTSCPRPAIAPMPSLPCSWSVKVISGSRLRAHPLQIEESDSLRLEDISLLQRLDGCKSTAECENEAISCTYGIEDPSDALWLRDYQSSTKFVVIFRVGLASLVFFVAAMICDGSIFEPHRSALSNSSASLLFLIGISALLYILLIPQHMQLSLYGAGPVQSMGFVFLVTSIACLLPATVVVWVNVAIFSVFFLGFLLEQLVYVFIGIMHFCGVLSLYQIENTLLHLRIIYTRDVLEQVEFDRRLLNMSQRFLFRVRQNWYLQRLPRALEEDALQIISNVLPGHLYDELVQEEIPQVEFDSLEREEAGEPENASGHGENADEGTPLLQANGPSGTTS